MSNATGEALSLDSSSPSGGIHMRVTPEPTPQEMAAIAAAVHVLQTAVAATPDAMDHPDMAVMSRWARAGRLDAMRCLASGIAEDFG